MPTGKSKKKKPAPRKTAKKALAKKTAGKKSARKKISVKKTARKIKVAKKKALKKKTVKKKAAATAKPGLGLPKPTKPLMVEPGPPPGGIPPVEEPASHEEAIGTVTHYYSHLSVAVIQINKGTLKTGDTIHIKGHGTDFIQQVESMQYEHLHVDQALTGQLVGLMVKDHAKEHDIVYLVK